MQMFGLSKIFLKDTNTFIQQGCIKLIKSDSEDIYHVTISIEKIGSFYASNNTQKNVSKNVYNHFFHFMKRKRNFWTEFFLLSPDAYTLLSLSTYQDIIESCSKEKDILWTGQSAPWYGLHRPLGAVYRAWQISYGSTNFPQPEKTKRNK